MRTLLLLALKNVRGAGLRTWLNVATLSFGFVTIVWMQGIYEGMMRQMVTAQIDTEYGGGQFWHKAFDPFDPLSFEDAHGEPGDALKKLVAEKKATPILLRTGAIFPNGRAQSVVLRGIEPTQEIVQIPGGVLLREGEALPGLIGKRMAEATGLKKGDTVTIRWRDVSGTFDATDVEVVEVMNIAVPGLDAGQLWLPLRTLRRLIGSAEATTLFVTEKGYVESHIEDPNFVWKNNDFLLSEERAIFESKKAFGYILYVILMAMGLLAVFDTQVLSIFRRRREIGTLMALGVTRSEVVGLFTLEGSLHGVLALFAGALWGIPILAHAAKIGIGLPKMSDNMGIAIGARLYASYAPQVLVVTLCVLLCSVVVVSFLPARRIAKMRPTDAIRGKG
ncbi:MAG: FtsX-like permease family protein [Bdellovibrionales bacterium]|nr:FtsX-like permease family protein [Bdellovibrionales bacterium]